eukprot:378734-Prymnesium_polylepis.1
MEADTCGGEHGASGPLSARLGLFCLPRSPVPSAVTSLSPIRVLSPGPRRVAPAGDRTRQAHLQDAGRTRPPPDRRLHLLDRRRVVATEP